MFADREQKQNRFDTGQPSMSLGVNRMAKVLFSTFMSVLPMGLAFVAILKTSRTDAE